MKTIDKTALSNYNVKMLTSQSTIDVLKMLLLWVFALLNTEWYTKE